MPEITFTARCPECGVDATWRQTSGDKVTAIDFLVRCATCEPPPPGPTSLAVAA